MVINKREGLGIRGTTQTSLRMTRIIGMIYASSDVLLIINLTYKSQVEPRNFDVTHTHQSCGTLPTYKFYKMTNYLIKFQPCQVRCSARNQNASYSSSPSFLLIFISLNYSKLTAYIKIYRDFSFKNVDT